jgi:hypothetical protein
VASDDEIEQGSEHSRCDDSKRLLMKSIFTLFHSSNAVLLLHVTTVLQKNRRAEESKLKTHYVTKKYICWDLKGKPVLVALMNYLRA